MNKIIINNVVPGYEPEKNEYIFDSIFKQYEVVIVSSLVNSFGLNFIMNDLYGGDVDTIHNVRQIDKDSSLSYKNKHNESDYLKNPQYNKDIKNVYDADYRYRKIYKDIRKEKASGSLIDAYTGLNIDVNENIDIDHVISTNEIHNDRGRLLAGLSGCDLANCRENLKPTDSSINRSMGKQEINDFIQKIESSKNIRNENIDFIKSKDKKDLTDKDIKQLHKDEILNSIDKNKMKYADNVARISYNNKIIREYYTSPKFAKDLTIAAGKVSIKNGLKQALGIIFAEIYFVVRDDIKKFNNEEQIDFCEFYKSIGNSVIKGFNIAKEKYKDIFDNVISGSINGALSSITTTICNIFFTTGKNFGLIIRQSYFSLIKAAEVLFINPDNYLYGERIRAVAKILSTGAGTVIGASLGEAINKTAVGNIPVIGEIIMTFVSSFVTGIMSCTFLYILDRNPLINLLVSSLNEIPCIEKTIYDYKKQADLFEKNAANLLKIDIKDLKEKIEEIESVSAKIGSADTPEKLDNVFTELNVTPWGNDRSFEDFMEDDSSKLVFKK